MKVPKLVLTSAKAASAKDRLEALRAFVAGYVASRPADGPLGQEAEDKFDRWWNDPSVASPQENLRCDDGMVHIPVGIMTFDSGLRVPVCRGHCSVLCTTPNPTLTSDNVDCMRCIAKATAVHHA